MNVDAPELVLSRAQPRTRDVETFEAVMRAHERQVLGTAFRLLGRMEDAQDAAQEVFTRLFRHLKSFDSDEDVARWLYRVTVNVCHDVWKKRRPMSDITELNLASGVADPETAAGELERQRAVVNGLATLAHKERAALVLREVEGLSTREVAEILGSSEVTVRTQICTARMKLKKFTERRLRNKR